MDLMDYLFWGGLITYGVCSLGLIIAIWVNQGDD